MKYYLAIDIGASSGRHILGHVEDGKIVTEEVYRFKNGVTERDGSLYWNTEALLGEIKAGIAKAKSIQPNIHSLAIDTWGVDYVLFRDNEEVLPTYAYRDTRTEKVMERVNAKIGVDNLYSRTGCQVQSFNTIYQLCSDLELGRLRGVTGFLMLPSYFTYKLCGCHMHEYTNATTTGLINAKTGEYDLELIKELGLPTTIFPEHLAKPGTFVGIYDGIRCVLCATHDTASAVEGIPMGDSHELYISSGTWSLLGVKTEAPITDLKSLENNISNEGGVGYNRYQKNIMGMWLVNELRRHLCPELDFGKIVELASVSTCDIALDIDREEFLAPKNMARLFDKRSGNRLSCLGDYFRCAYNSLAESYARAIRGIEKITGKKYTKIYIVGGGAKNMLLNGLTERATGKQVVALPIEATALGNLKIQMEAENELY